MCRRKKSIKILVMDENLNWWIGWMHWKQLWDTRQCVMILLGGKWHVCVCVCVGSLGHHLGEFFVSAIYWRICLPFSMCLFSFHSSFAFGSSSCQKTTTRELDKYKDYLRFVQTPLGGHGGLWVARSPMFASVDAGASMGCLLRSFHFDAGDNQELW